jgi:hypothetical protein
MLRSRLVLSPEMMSSKMGKVRPEDDSMSLRFTARTCFEYQQGIRLVRVATCSKTPKRYDFDDRHS